MSANPIAPRRGQTAGREKPLPLSRERPGARVRGWRGFAWTTIRPIPWVDRERGGPPGPHRGTVSARGVGKGARPSDGRGEGHVALTLGPHPGKARAPEAAWHLGLAPRPGG